MCVRSAFVKVRSLALQMEWASGKSAHKNPWHDRKMVGSRIWHWTLDRTSFLFFPSSLCRFYHLDGIVHTTNCNIYAVRRSSKNCQQIYPDWLLCYLTISLIIGWRLSDFSWKHLSLEDVTTYWLNHVQILGVFSDAMGAVMSRDLRFIGFASEQNRSSTNDSMKARKAVGR